MEGKAEWRSKRQHLYRILQRDTLGYVSEDLPQTIKANLDRLFQLPGPQRDGTRQVVRKAGCESPLKAIGSHPENPSQEQTFKLLIRHKQRGWAPDCPNSGTPFTEGSRAVTKGCHGARAQCPKALGLNHSSRKRKKCV